MERNSEEIWDCELRIANFRKMSLLDDIKAIPAEELAAEIIEAERQWPEIEREYLIAQGLRNIYQRMISIRPEVKELVLASRSKS